MSEHDRPLWTQAETCAWQDSCGCRRSDYLLLGLRRIGTGGMTRRKVRRIR